MCQQGNSTLYYIPSKRRRERFSCKLTLMERTLGCRCPPDFWHFEQTKSRTAREETNVGTPKLEANVLLDARQPHTLSSNGVAHKKAKQRLTRQRLYLQTITSI